MSYLRDGVEVVESKVLWLSLKEAMFVGASGNDVCHVETVSHTKNSDDWRDGQQDKQADDYHLS